MSERDAVAAGVPVGVLLPLRLETRFDDKRLRLRIVPDEPWFARHDPKASDGELTMLERYLAASRLGPDDPATQLAWGELVRAVGGGRAVWLVRTFVQQVPGGAVVVRPDPSQLQTQAAFPRISGFPSELHVWLARAGGPPTLAASLRVAADELAVDFPDPTDAGDARWWESWPAAVELGLAAELTLDGDPSDIDVLYVTGLGEGDPGELFADHRDNGRLGLLASGTPTNSVDGAPASSLGHDPGEWLDVLRTPADDSEQLVSQSITGDPRLLGNLPGPSEPHRDAGSAMVAALWPALWGFVATDTWATGGSADAADWAPLALWPEGPLPTLRIGSQPYGLLSATALSRWVAAKDDPPVEERVRKGLLVLRQLWAQAAEGRGTAAGASTEQLLDLLGHVPTAPFYLQRRAEALEIYWMILVTLGYPLSWADFDAAWRQQYPLVADLELKPARRYGSDHRPELMPMPLVVPADLPAHHTIGTVLRRLAQFARQFPHMFTDTAQAELEIFQFRTNSLLLRLVIRSLQLALGDVGREAAGEVPPGPEPLSRPGTQPGRLEGWIALVQGEMLRSGTPAALAFERVAGAVERLSGFEPERLERLLRATVETAQYRLDPWLIAAPARRLQSLLDGSQAAPRLGAYGWVDAPRPGRPGPTAGGLLHAPSPAQALTATVLRDRALNDPEPKRWQLALDSRVVRDAERLAEHVRTGVHLSEALGREVERIAAGRKIIEQLRKAFPIRTEHAGRRVCDGQAVLAADPATLGFDAAKRAELDRLRLAIDAYGDLLVAEAVHHVTQGRTEVAGAAMDAAAGLTRPPDLEVLRTPRQGRAVTTSVLALVPFAAAPAIPAGELEHAELAPTTLADASAAAFVAAQAGQASAWTWTVAHGTATAGVNLGGLGLSPADALALPVADLERLVAEAGALTLGTPVEEVELTARDGSARYETAARVVALLGRTPAGRDATTDLPDAPEPDTVDTLDDELRSRYAAVRGTAELLLQRLAGQIALFAPDGTTGNADPVTVGRLVAACRRWGIAPDPPPETPGVLPWRVIRAQALLGSRVAAAPTVTDAAALDRPALLDALTALVSPTGQLAVLARITRDRLPALQRAGDLDADWLALVAATRAPLARLEVHQLAAAGRLGGAALTAWANKPADPWQADEDDTRRLVVAYAPAGLDAGALAPTAPVAAAVLDRWTEVVPDTEHTTAAAFGFDAPAARAPQAILLAVPPDLETGLDAETVRDVVAETRELAHARMARPEDLPAGLRDLLPTVIVPATGRTRIPLSPA